MKQITEDYVSYDIAKLLKEKGFPQCKKEEVHNIHISVQPDYPSKTNYKLSWCWSVNMLHKDCFECKKHQSYIDTFEQAVGAAILYVLKNLI